MSSKDLVKKIKTEVSKINKDVIGYRRHLHMHPELSFEEVQTSAYVKSILDRNGISYVDGYCEHGLVAEIKGAKKGRIIYLRGDMDALPIREENEVSYKSKKRGHHARLWTRCTYC